MKRYARKYQVMEFQQRKCCVILELSSNLPRVLEFCTSAIPQAFLDGTDTIPSRLTEVIEFQKRKCCVILELSSNLPRVLEFCTSAIPQAFLDGTDTIPSRLTEEGTNVPEVALPEVVVMEFQQRKCCVILELSSNLPRVLQFCTSAIPQAFLDGTDTIPSRLTEEGTNVPEVALPEVVVPGRDKKDGLVCSVRSLCSRRSNFSTVTAPYLLLGSDVVGDSPCGGKLINFNLYDPSIPRLKIK
ncbi:hypothetical protein F2Q70_00001985 [Brassica cretica]|uniref:E3 ubiquitin-protein ligase RNF123/RKP TPR repeat domain-containing protein n=1 Tax=Brassica cretica TaxID=69181 RepID=A0A8S9IWV0_BRACR|nr:hypothetical protein F2Q70_00001985 [Brassica cretica]